MPGVPWGRKPLPVWRKRRVLHTTVAVETFEFVAGHSGGRQPWNARGEVVDDAVSLLRAVLDTCPDKSPKGLQRRLLEVEDMIRGAGASPSVAVKAR